MIFYTADPHFSHQRINELCKRPFSSVEEMNEELIRRWNSVVWPHHTVYVLGDFLMGPKVDSFRIPARLNGEIILVPGNHDMCHPMHAKTPQKLQEWQDRYLETGISRIAPVQQVRWMMDYEVTVCHFPPQGDSHDEDRHSEYRPEWVPGGWVLHGHVHEAWRQRGTWINVGVDAWAGYPVPLRCLEDMMLKPPQDLAPLEWSS
jgi:calcineurin-like phosphoesterase family protein